MTFTIHDADLDKLHEILKDINVKECPWFEVQDKHGNKAKYYREPQWIPCIERPPDEDGMYLTTSMYSEVHCDYWNVDHFNRTELVIAWQPLPSPYQKEGE